MATFTARNTLSFRVSGFPRIAQSSRGFTQAHGEVHDSLQPHRVSRRQPIAMREDKFGIAQNSGQRVIDLVAKYVRGIRR
jgi:hypothetical protein